MSNFNSLVNNIKETDKAEEYLAKFFVRKNYSDYEVNDLANKDQIKAIKIMFTSKKELSERIDEAFSYDPFCVEALFAYLMISEDVFLQLRFNAYYDEAKNYGGFDEYTKICYIEILNLYVDFLLDIENITKAILIQNLIIKLTNTCSKQAITKLAFCFYAIEDADRFYRLYLDTEFGAYEYILCLVTLLKHDEDIKAQEVLLDMFKNIEYATYLDHAWDLDENDPVQKEFSDTVNDCVQEIFNIPTFFSWVNRIREKYAK